MLTDAQVQAAARPGESWDTARRRLTKQYDRLAALPRQMMPCPLCQGDDPDKPWLWCWVEFARDAPVVPDMCDRCESHPRQWGCESDEIN